MTDAYLTLIRDTVGGTNARSSIGILHEENKSATSRVCGASELGFEFPELGARGRGRPTSDRFERGSRRDVTLGIRVPIGRHVSPGPARTRPAREKNVFCFVQVGVRVAAAGHLAWSDLLAAVSLPTRAARPAQDSSRMTGKHAERAVAAR